MNKSPSAQSASRLIIPAFVTLILMATTLLVSCSGDPDDPVFPGQPLPEARNWLYDIEGTGPNDIWACGNKGAMFHFDGSTWSPVSMGTSQPITSMYRASDGNLYACGHEGKIWRNSGGNWSSMESGTSGDLYALGSYLGNIYATGFDGNIRMLSGGSWSGVSRNEIITRDEAGAPQDTLYRNRDIVSLSTVNQYAIGGSYRDPLYEGEEVGMQGTRGMILAEDSEFDWILRPLGGDQLVDSEWIISNHSDPTLITNNYLGTTEGWIFRLNENANWVLMPPRVTNDPQGGIRDFWLDANFNTYIVTDEGQLVFQTSDFEFQSGTGSRIFLEDFVFDFAAIWGTDPMNMYIVGFMEDRIIRVSHDQAAETLTWETIPLEFPDKSLPGGPAVDQFGRPLH